MKATHDRSPLLLGDHYSVPVKAGDLMLATLMDIPDVERLGERKLSLGSHGYVQLYDDGQVQLLHRWLFGVTGLGYRVIVDHEDRDKLNNRRYNLRKVDGSTSNANRPQADGQLTSVFQVRSGRYQGHFRWRGKRHHVGTFDTAELAAAAVRAYRELHCPDSLPPKAA